MLDEIQYWTKIIWNWVGPLPSVFLMNFYQSLKHRDDSDLTLQICITITTKGCNTRLEIYSTNILHAQIHIAWYISPIGFIINLRAYTAGVQMQYGFLYATFCLSHTSRHSYNSLGKSKQNSDAFFHPICCDLFLHWDINDIYDMDFYTLHVQIILIWIFAQHAWLRYSTVISLKTLAGITSQEK
jgi:hypothetical protein